MAHVQLDPPEIDADETSDPYKQRVALLVAALTLLGSAVAFLQVRESNAEGSAAQEAQRQAILGLGSTFESSSELTKAYDVYGQAKLLERRSILARARNRFALGGGDAATFAIEAQRWSAVRDSLSDLSALFTPEFSEAKDPRFPNRYSAEIFMESDRARLRVAAKAEEQQAHAAKSGAYVAVITVLAVAGFLIGLSLTVSGTARRILVGSGVVVAVWALVWSFLIMVRSVPSTSAEAMEAVAQGNRHVTEGNLDEAVNAYNRAIELRADYAVAYLARSSAVFLQGSTQSTSQYVSITKDENLRAAIRDQEQAIRGAGDDITLLSSLGFNYFLAKRYDESVRLTKSAKDLNDRLAFLWYNLGVAELARGNERAAESLYRHGNALTASPETGDERKRSEVFAAARTDLELLARLEPSRAEVAGRYAAMVTESQAASLLQVPVTALAESASIRTIRDSTDGASVQTEFQFTDIPAGTPMSYIWYYRPDGQQPWAQIPQMNYFEKLPDGGTGRRIVRAALAACQVPGQYRLDIYAGTSRLSSSEQGMEPPRLGPLVLARDEVRGVSLCVPESWERHDDDNLDALTYNATNIVALVAVTTYVVPADVLSGPPLDFLDFVLRTVTPAGASANLQNFRIGGIDGRRATVNAGAADAFTVAAAVGRDNVLRVVSWAAPAPDLVAAEILPTVVFDVGR